MQAKQLELESRRLDLEAKALDHAKKDAAVRRRAAAIDWSIKLLELDLIDRSKLDQATVSKLDKTVDKVRAAIDAMDLDG